MENGSGALVRRRKRIGVGRLLLFVGVRHQSSGVCCARYLRVEEGVGCCASPHPLTCDAVGEGGFACSRVPVGMEDVELEYEEVCVSL